MIHRSCISSQEDKGGDNTIISDTQQTGYPVEAAATLNPTTVKAGHVEHTGQHPVRNVMFRTVSCLLIQTGTEDMMAHITVHVTQQAKSTFKIKVINKLGLVAGAGKLPQTQGQPGLHSVFQVSQIYSVKK